MSEEEQAAEHNTKSKCICLETVEANDPSLIALKCGHVYHTKCIADWLIEHGTCPYCREHDGVDRRQRSYRRNDTIQAVNAFLNLIMFLHFGMMLLVDTLEYLEASTIDVGTREYMGGARWMLYLSCIALTCYLKKEFVSICP